MHLINGGREGGSEGAGGQVQPQPKEEQNLWNLASVKIQPCWVWTLEIFRLWPHMLPVIKTIRLKCCSGFTSLLTLLLIFRWPVLVWWGEIVLPYKQMMTDVTSCFHLRLKRLIGCRELWFYYIIKSSNSWNGEISFSSLFWAFHSTLLHRYKWHFCI